MSVWSSNDETLSAAAILVSCRTNVEFPRWLDEACVDLRSIDPNVEICFELDECTSGRRGRSAGSVLDILSSRKPLIDDGDQSIPRAWVVFSNDSVVRLASRLMEWCRENSGVLTACWAAFDNAWRNGDLLTFDRNEPSRIAGRLLRGLDLIPFADCQTTAEFRRRQVAFAELDGLFISWIYSRRGPLSTAIKLSKSMLNGMVPSVNSALARIAWTRAQAEFRVSGLVDPPEVIVPVPSRGERSSKLLAALGAGYAKANGTPLKPLTLASLLQRREATTEIKELRWDDRLAAAEALYCLASNYTPPRSVLLADDVVTSGSSMRACSRLLRSAGVKKIYGIAICACPEDAPFINAHPISHINGA